MKNGKKTEDENSSNLLQHGKLLFWNNKGKKIVKELTKKKLYKLNVRIAKNDGKNDEKLLQG